MKTDILFYGLMYVDVILILCSSLHRMISQFKDTLHKHFGITDKGDAADSLDSRIIHIADGQSLSRNN